MTSPISDFLPWTQAFAAAGVEGLRNARGHWGHKHGRRGLVVCSVWDDNIEGSRARSYVPKRNVGGYREAATALSVGAPVILVLRSRKTEQGLVMPTVWKVREKHLDQEGQKSIGFIDLSNTGEPI